VHFFASTPAPPRPGGEASCCGPPPPRLFVATRRSRQPELSSLQLGAELDDVAIVVRRCCNRCPQMLHECTRSCCMNVLGHVAIIFQRCFNHRLHMFAFAFVLQYMISIFMFAIIFFNVAIVVHRCCISCISMLHRFLYLCLHEM
jgi:hypothetical protein